MVESARGVDGIEVIDEMNEEKKRKDELTKSGGTKTIALGCEWN